MTASLRDVEVDEEGVAVWHARTVPELADAVRYLAGRLQSVEPPPPPDLSGYVPVADFEALQATVTALQTQVTEMDAEIATLNTDLDALEARVTALETPAP